MTGKVTPAPVRGPGWYAVIGVAVAAGIAVAGAVAIGAARASADRPPPDPNITRLGNHTVTYVTLRGDGRDIPCFILDAPDSGASLSCDWNPK